MNPANILGWDKLYCTYKKRKHEYSYVNWNVYPWTLGHSNDTTWENAENSNWQFNIFLTESNKQLVTFYSYPSELSTVLAQWKIKYWDLDATKQ